MSLRQERLKKEFFKIITEFFLYKVGNPMLLGINVQEIDVSRDLSYLKIFYYTDTKVTKEFERALIKVAPAIKSSISRTVRLRKVPEITFVFDNRKEYTQKVNTILDNITYSEQSEEELISNYKNLEIEDHE